MTVTDSSRGVIAAESLDPHRMFAAIREAGVTHVVTVPDTHQKSLLALLAAADDPELLTVCTEDEAMGVNTGLIVGGKRPLLLIQNAGVYASMNSLRGLALDGRIPTCMLIGEFLRDPAVPSRDNRARVVHLLEPTLELWGVPCYRLDHDEDIPNIGVAMDRAFSERGPVALLVGARTADAS